MIGSLPQSLTVGGEKYPIETDYRNILSIFEAFGDPELTDQEKLYVMMRRLLRDALAEIPEGMTGEALHEAKWFIDCGQSEEDKKPPRKVIDWEQDEALIFPAVNKVAGKEVRAVEYMHWWTFCGYFMEIEEGTFSTVLGIRQKRSKGKKLEKWENEFYRNNQKLCNIKQRYTAEDQAEIDHWNELLG